MSSINSPFYQGNINEDFDYDDDNMDDFYYDNNGNQDDSENSDTEEASEAEYNTSSHRNEEPIEIKEQ